VGVGGGFNGPPITTRLTTRRRTDEGQATSGLGFRCSAGASTGRRLGEQLATEAPHSSLDPSRTTALFRWHSERGSAALDSYRVIQGFEFVAFVPVASLAAESPAELEAQAEASPIELGRFSTSLMLVSPKLDPGTYTVTFRAPAQLDFRTEAGPLAARISCDPVTLVPWSDSTTTWTTSTTATDSDAALVGERLDLQLCLRRTGWSESGIGLRLALLAASGTITNDWRQQLASRTTSRASTLSRSDTPRTLSALSPWPA